MTAQPATGVAAWVAGEPVTVAEVDTRLAALRSTQFGPRLPPADSAEGRNARRWVTQIVCAERIVRTALAERGIATGGHSRRLQIDKALALGGVAAVVLATFPELGVWAGGWQEAPPESAIRDYYRHNPDLYADRGIRYCDARDQIASELHETATERSIAAWLDQRLTCDTVLAAGFEHPADPANPDATHRH